MQWLTPPILKKKVLRAYAFAYSDTHLTIFLQRLFRILSDSIRFPRKTMTAKAELTSPQRFGFLRFGFLRFSRCKIWSSAGSHPTTLVQLQLRLHSLNVLTGSSINANDIPFINKRWSNKFGARFDLYRFGYVCRSVPPWPLAHNIQPSIQLDLEVTL